MTYPAGALQAAIFTALSGNLTGVGGLPCPVYDRVPQKTAYPYVAFDTQTSVPDDPLASQRSEIAFFLSVWSTYKGQLEVLQVMGQIHDLIHQARLTLDAGRNVRCYVIRQATQREPDNETFQGQVTIRAIVEH